LIAISGDARAAEVTAEPHSTTRRTKTDARTPWRTDSETPREGAAEIRRPVRWFDVDMGLFLRIGKTVANPRGFVLDVEIGGLVPSNQRGGSPIP